MGGLQQLTYVCKPITSGDVWFRRLYREAWCQSAAPALGSHVEVRYAPGSGELKTMLELSDPAPVGFSFYTTEARYRTVHRMKYPEVLPGTGADEVLDVVRTERRVLISKKLLRQLFGEVLGEDYKHVLPVSAECVMKPRESVRGLFWIVYDPRLAKSMRTRYTRCQERAEKARQESEAQEKKKREFQERERQRERLGKDRKAALKAVLSVLRPAVLDVLDPEHTGVELPGRFSEFNCERDLMKMVRQLLRLCDVLQPGAEVLLNPDSAIVRRLLKSSEIDRGDVGYVRKLIRNLDKHLGVYAAPLRNRKAFPGLSGISAETDTTHPNVWCAAEREISGEYRDVYARLRAVIAKIKDQRRKKQPKRRKGAA